MPSQSPDLPPDTLEPHLIEALQPIRFHALAACVHHLFDTGLYDALAERGAATVAALAGALDLDPARLDAFLRYLRNEGLLDATGGAFRLTRRGLALAPFRGYYALLIGGYARTFAELGAALRRGAPPAGRDGAQVGAGSCAISQYDAIPLTRSLMRRIPGGARRVLDLGCGDAGSLIALCDGAPELEALGVEPDDGGFARAVASVRAARLEHRIRLVHATAQDYLRGDAAASEPAADAAVIAFVLQELLGQDGEAAVVDHLASLVQRHPELHLIVIEVEHRVDEPIVSRHGLGLAYYNPYYLLHPFTRQRLESAAFWQQLFERAGLELVAREAVTADVDSTGLTVGFLLRRRR